MSTETKNRQSRKWLLTITRPTIELLLPYQPWLSAGRCCFYNVPQKVIACRLNACVLPTGNFSSDHIPSPPDDRNRANYSLNCKCLSNVLKRSCRPFQDRCESVSQKSLPLNRLFVSAMESEQKAIPSFWAIRTNRVATVGGIDFPRKCSATVW